MVLNKLNHEESPQSSHILNMAHCSTVETEKHRKKVHSAL